MAFSILDINQTFELINDNNKILPKDVIYLVVLADWIKSGIYEVKRSIKKEVITDFIYSKSKELATANDFLKAIRSFIIAHPLNTTNHPKYKLDGSFVCIDINLATDVLMFVNEKDCCHLNINGIIENCKNLEDNIILKVYSTLKPKFFKIITFNLNDILYSLELYIRMMYELANYLTKQKNRV